MTILAAILITAMICTTLLIISFRGVDIRINKNYNQVFRDETAFQSIKEEDTSVLGLKELLKKNKDESEEVDDFVQATTNVYNDYFKEKGGNLDGKE